MKSLQAQDVNAQQMLPEVQPEGWPAGRGAEDVAVPGSLLLGYVLLRAVTLLEPAACTSTGNQKAAVLVPRFPELMSGKFLGPVVP